ncbi:hypothetical protein E1B28_012836 [Marasmius oreades]|nr:uncharacterized protein E1B28_012836 [Marasmius oreades]KAG7088890.1 hypothetical protein E1B28_012836 [Marasmius oreades]
MFRRGQARVGLGIFADAKNDFEAAMKLDPNNQAVQDELEKLRNKPPVKGKFSPPKVLETPAGVRRRVPIKIIESESPSTPPRASEPLKPESIATPEPPSETSLLSAAPKTFQDAKRVRDEAKLPARVGGGIFRASGKNTIFTPRGELETKEGESSNTISSSKTDPSTTTTSSRTTPGASNPAINEKSVTTLFDFTKSWLSLTTSSDRFQLINRVSPSAYPSFFKTSLEPSLLISIIQTYLDITTSEPNAMARVKESMEGFLHVPRISTIALFLSRKEKEIVLQILERLDDEALSNRWRGILKC